jgi:hypothetical protein
MNFSEVVREEIESDNTFPDYFKKKLIVLAEKFQATPIEDGYEEKNDFRERAKS